jgi:hypothetical protein
VDAGTRRSRDWLWIVELPALYPAVGSILTKQLPVFLYEACGIPCSFMAFRLPQYLA